MRDQMSFIELPSVRCNNLIAGITAVIGIIGGIYLITKTTNDLICKITNRKQKQTSETEFFCNVCCTEIDVEDEKTCVKCYICKKYICRNIKCSNWLEKTAKWECELCQTSKESLAQTSSWVADQITFNHEELIRPPRARSEIYIPISEYNDSLIHFESVSQIGANSNAITAEQKTKIREYVEEVVSNLLGGNLDTVSVNQLSRSENYLADSQAKNIHNGTSQQSGTARANVQDFSDISETRLRKMIEKIIAETISISPPLTNGHAVSEISLDRNSRTIDSRPLGNHGYYPRHRTEHYFEPAIYQDLLATAVLNKIVDKQLNSKHDFPERDVGGADVIDNIGLASSDQNFNIEKTSTSSGSSVDPRSDCSYPEVETNNDDKTSEFLANSDRDSVMSDYLANHMIPLPDLNAIATESEEDDYTSVTSSAIGDGTWEKNWLFKRKKSTLSASVTTSSIGMLVPDPKEDVRAQIGDKTADEVSDLSEIGSDSDDSLNSLRSQLEPINDRLINKHIIGGQNNKMILDELIERSSMISNDVESTYTDACNEQIINGKTKNEAINDNVNQQKSITEKQIQGSEAVVVCSAATEDLNSNSLTASDDNSDFEGCTGFSAVEIIESTSRTPSVVEILAAMALGPMLAVPSLDQPVAMTVSDFNALTELKDLALAEIKSRALESVPYNLDVIPEEPGDIANLSGNGVDCNNTDITTSQENYQYSPLPLIQEMTEPESEPTCNTDASEPSTEIANDKPTETITETVAIATANLKGQSTLKEENTLNEEVAKSQDESTKSIAGKSNLGIGEKPVKYSTELIGKEQHSTPQSEVYKELTSTKNQRDFSKSSNVQTTEKLETDNASDKHFIDFNKEKVTDKSPEIHLERNEDISKDQSFNNKHDAVNDTTCAHSHLDQQNSTIDNLSSLCQKEIIARQHPVEKSADSNYTVPQEKSSEALDTTDNANTSEEDTKQQHPKEIEEKVAKKQHSETQAEEKERVAKDSLGSCKSEEFTKANETLSADRPETFSDDYLDCVSHTAELEECTLEEPPEQVDETSSREQSLQAQGEQVEAVCNAQLGSTMSTSNFQEYSLQENSTGIDKTTSAEYQQNKVVSTDNNAKTEECITDEGTAEADENMFKGQHSEQTGKDSNVNSETNSIDNNSAKSEEERFKDVDGSVFVGQLSSEKIERVFDYLWESTNNIAGPEEYGSEETPKEVDEIICDEQFYETQIDQTETVPNEQLDESGQYSKEKYSTEIDETTSKEQFYEIEAKQIKTMSDDYTAAVDKKAASEECVIENETMYKGQFSETQAESFETASDSHSDYFINKSFSEGCTREQQINFKYDPSYTIAEQTEIEECNTEENSKELNETTPKQQSPEKQVEQNEKVSDDHSVSKNTTKPEECTTKEHSNRVDDTIPKEEFYEAETEQTKTVPNKQFDHPLEEDARGVDLIESHQLESLSPEHPVFTEHTQKETKTNSTSEDYSNLTNNTANLEECTTEQHAKRCNEAISEETSSETQDERTETAWDDQSDSIANNLAPTTIPKVGAQETEIMTTEQLSEQLHSTINSATVIGDHSGNINNKPKTEECPLEEHSEQKPTKNHTERLDETFCIQNSLHIQMKQTDLGPTNITHKCEHCTVRELSTFSETQDEAEACTLEEPSTCIAEKAPKEQISKTEQQDSKLVSDGNTAKAEETCSDEAAVKEQEQKTKAISNSNKEKADECTPEGNFTCIDETPPTQQAFKTQEQQPEVLSDDKTDKAEECTVGGSLSCINEISPKEEVSETLEQPSKYISNSNTAEDSRVEEISTEVVSDHNTKKVEECTLEENVEECTLEEKVEECTLEEHSTCIDETAPKEQVSETEEEQTKVISDNNTEKVNECTAPNEQVSKTEQQQTEVVSDGITEKVEKKHSTSIVETASKEHVSEIEERQTEVVSNNITERVEECKLEGHSICIVETASTEHVSEPEELQTKVISDDITEKVGECAVHKLQVSETENQQTKVISYDITEKVEECTLEEHSTASKEQVCETEEQQTKVISDDITVKVEECTLEEHSTESKEQGSETGEQQTKVISDHITGKEEECTIEEQSSFLVEITSKEQVCETEEQQTKVISDDITEKVEECTLEEHSTESKEQVCVTEEQQLKVISDDITEKVEEYTLEEHSTESKEQVCETEEQQTKAISDDIAVKVEECTLEEHSTESKEQVSETEELQTKAISEDITEKVEECTLEEHSTASKEQVCETEEQQTKVISDDIAVKVEECTLDEHSTESKEQDSETEELQTKVISEDITENVEECTLEEHSTASKEQLCETEEQQTKVIADDIAVEVEECTLDEHSTESKEQDSETEELQTKVISDDIIEKVEECTLEEHSTESKEQVCETEEQQTKVISDDIAEKVEECTLEEHSTASKEQVCETEEQQTKVISDDITVKVEECTLEEHSTASKEQVCETEEQQLKVISDDIAVKVEECTLEEHSTESKEQGSETREQQTKVISDHITGKEEECTIEEQFSFLVEITSKEQVSETEGQQTEVASEEHSSFTVETTFKEQVSEIEQQSKVISDDITEKVEECILEELSTSIIEIAPKEHVSEPEEQQTKVISDDITEKVEECTLEEHSTSTVKTTFKEHVCEIEEQQTKVISHDITEKVEECILEDLSTSIVETAPKEHVSEPEEQQTKVISDDITEKVEECTLEEHSTESKEQVCETEEQQTEVASEEHSSFTVETTFKEQVSEIEQQSKVISDDITESVEKCTLEEHSTSTVKTTFKEHVCEIEEQQTEVISHDITEKVEECIIEELSTSIVETAPKEHVSEPEEQQTKVILEDIAGKEEECTLREPPTSIMETASKEQNSETEEQQNKVVLDDITGKVEECTLEEPPTSIIETAPKEQTSETEEQQPRAIYDDIKEKVEEYTLEEPFTCIVETASKEEVSETGEQQTKIISDDVTEKVKECIAPKEQVFEAEEQQTKIISDDITEGVEKCTLEEHSKSNVETAPKEQVSETEEQQTKVVSHDITEKVEECTLEEHSTCIVETGEQKTKVISDDITEKVEECTLEEHSSSTVETTFKEQVSETEKQQTEVVPDNNTEKVEECALEERSKCITETAPKTFIGDVSSSEQVSEIQEHQTKIISNYNTDKGKACTVKEHSSAAAERMPKTDLLENEIAENGGLLCNNSIEHDYRIFKEQLSQQLTNQTDTIRHSDSTNNTVNKQSEIDYESKLAERSAEEQLSEAQSKQLLSDAQLEQINTMSTKQSIKPTVHDISSSTKSEAESKMCDETSAPLSEMISREECLEKHLEHPAEDNRENISKSSKEHSRDLEEEQPFKTQAKQINTVSSHQYDEQDSAKCTTNEESKSEDMPIEHPKEYEENTFLQPSEIEDGQIKMVSSEQSVEINVNETLSSASSSAYEQTKACGQPTVPVPRSKTNSNPILDFKNMTTEAEATVTSDDQISSECSPTITRQSTVVQISSTSNRTDDCPSAGSIAEREYKKWYNAVDMPNNPYAPEALKRRISGSQERYIDLPNIVSPTKDLNPLQLLTEQHPDADANVKLENDYKRYSRDYYINSSLTTSQTPPAKDGRDIFAKDNREDTKILSSSMEKEARIDLYKAIPAQVIEDSSSLTETMTLTPTEMHTNIRSASDDSDTIKVNDSLIPQDIKSEQETVGEIKSEVDASVNLAGKMSESTMAPARGSTPVAFKFLQPKRKLLQPNQVLTTDEEEPDITSSQYEKPVIEAEVVKALPSVKALARAFLMTTNTSQPEKLWLRKARTLSLSGKKRATSASTLSVDQIMQFERLKPEDDVTISSDLSSLETDSCSVGTEIANSSDVTPPAASSATDPSSASAAGNVSPVPVRQGVLKNNIAFFENLKNK